MIVPVPSVLPDVMDAVKTSEPVALLLANDGIAALLIRTVSIEASFVCPCVRVQTLVPAANFVLCSVNHLRFAVVLLLDSDPGPEYFDACIRPKVVRRALGMLINKT